MGNNKNLKIFFIFFFIIASHTFVVAKDVLLLHSYHKGYSWSDDISRAIEDKFKLHNIELTTEYMDTKKVYTPEYLESLKEFYLKRYANRSFDLIIASDNNALDFLAQYHDTIFTDVPIVFCGINNFELVSFKNSTISKRTTGVVEQVDIEKNLQLIKELHPKISKLLVINDTTTTGQNIKKELEKLLPKYSTKLTIEYIDQFDIDALKQKVKHLDKNSVILFMLLFKDQTGKTFTFKDGLEAIEKNTNVPIYGLWDFYLEHGLIGGYLTYGYEQGRNAAKLALRILEGIPIEQVDIIHESPNSYIFNYPKLQEFGIKLKNLPKNSIIRNKPFSFYETYTKEIVIVTIAFIIFLIIIVILIFSLIEKKRTKNQLRDQLNFIETLLNTISNPIFYKNRQGKYIGCNEAFCQFIGKPKEEILGKTMYDFFTSQPKFLEAHKEIERKLFNNEEVSEYIMDYTLPNQAVKTMIINKTLYYNTDGNIKGILTILHDITKLSQVEKEKKQHESFLVQQSKLAEIGEMISAIAHQWNEPLVEMSAIVQDLQLQHQTSSLSKEDIDTFVNDSMIQIQYMSKTLKDFRDFLKPSVKKSTFDIKEAFDEVLNILERQIKYSYIDLSIEYDKENIQVYGYKNEFMQVLISILNNSKDAISKMKKEDKNFKGKIILLITQTSQKAIINIIDNGCGVKVLNKEKVFEPYFSTKSKGNGLGLYMSKVLIEEKMNGKIYFADDQKGTKLTIELPVQKGIS